MSKITYVLLAAAIAFSFTLAHADQAMKADRQSIDTGCATDAATAGCGSDKVGTGLLKCLHAYKKANKSYKFSESCQTAMKQWRTDKKAGK